MKKYGIILISTIIILGLGACSNISNPSDEINTRTKSSEITIGAIHTEFLEKLYTDNFTKLIKERRVEKSQVIANQILESHGFDPMTIEEIEYNINLGIKKAQMNPIKLIEDILNKEELNWWNRFSSEARVVNAHKIYIDHCYTYGTPTKGTVLSDLIDVSLSSAEFWNKYRKNDVLIYHNPYIPKSKSWRNVIRFVVAVVVDGTAGGAAGSGAGPIVGGIVGGLASEGADNLLFGGDSKVLTGGE